MHDKLAKRTQHQKREEAAERINKHKRRTCLRQPAAGAKKQAGADRAANGDHLDLTWLEGLVVTEFLFDEDLTFGRRRFPRMHGYLSSR